MFHKIKGLKAYPFKQSSFALGLSHNAHNWGSKSDYYNFDEEVDLKAINTSIEIGVGFQMHFNDELKLVWRPSYVITKIPSNKPNRFFKGDYHKLRMAFGVLMDL